MYLKTPIIFRVSLIHVYFPFSLINRPDLSIFVLKNTSMQCGTSALCDDDNERINLEMLVSRFSATGLKQGKSGRGR